MEARVISTDTEKPFIQYLINVRSLQDNKAMWQICRRFKHINILQKRLEELFDNDLPCSAIIMKQYWNFSENNLKGTFSTEEKKSSLEK